MKLRIFYILYIIQILYGFDIQNLFLISNAKFQDISILQPKINMYYNKFKDYESPITILPTSQTLTIIDNWLNATIAMRNSNLEYVTEKTNSLGGVLSCGHDNIKKITCHF